MLDPLILQLGVLTTAQLSALGWSKWQIERAVRARRLERLRPGWLGAAGADPAARRAARMGGCISCFDALALRGAWQPAGRSGHVRLRRPGRSSRTCRPLGGRRAVATIVDDVETAIRCVLRCATREEAVAVLDSALHRSLVTMDELHELLDRAPTRLRRLLDLIDGRSESGTESMVRVRLRALGLHVRIQVRVMQGIRVDLLVGDRLIIECDSVAHHTDMAAYEADRARDRRLTARGYLVMRLTHRQIHTAWPEIAEDILTTVRRGDHRWSGSARRIGR